MNCQTCNATMSPREQVCSSCKTPTVMQENFKGRVLIKKYILEEKLGGGGFGEVWRARDNEIERDVAIKILHKHLGGDPDIVSRFKAEGKIAGQLQHPYALKIYQIGQTEDGYLWLAMELLSGKDLFDTLEASGPLSLDKLVEILQHVCEVLDEAHQKHIVHRDIKPQNIFITKYQNKIVPKLLDFGISSIASGKKNEQSKMVLGSFSYMAPEQFKGARYATKLSDIYSLGVTVYLSLSGKLPLDADDITEWAVKHFGATPEAPTPLQQWVPRLPAGVCEVVMKALEKDQNKRPQSALEFWNLFAKAVNQTVPRRPVEPTQIYESPFVNNTQSESVSQKNRELEDRLKELESSLEQRQKQEEEARIRLEQESRQRALYEARLREESHKQKLLQERLEKEAKEREEQLRREVFVQRAAYEEKVREEERKRMLLLQEVEAQKQNIKTPAPEKISPSGQIASASVSQVVSPQNRLVQEIELARTQKRRFVVGSQVVVDVVTNLMWSVCDNGRGRKPSYADADRELGILSLNWFEACRYVESCQDGGYTDWKIPNVEELHTLHESGAGYHVMEGNTTLVRICDAIRLSGFVYWLREHTVGPSHAAMFSFISGKADWENVSVRRSTYRVLPVRRFVG